MLALVTTVYSTSHRSVPKYPVQDTKEGSNLEFDLRWGKGNRPATNNLVNTMEEASSQYLSQCDEEGRIRSK